MQGLSADSNKYSFYLVTNESWSHTLSVILKKKMTTVNAETWRPRDNFLAECGARRSDKITRNRGNGTMGWKWDDESQSCSLSVTTTQTHSKAELKLRCSLL